MCYLEGEFRTGASDVLLARLEVAGVAEPVTFWMGADQDGSGDPSAGPLIERAPNDAGTCLDHARAAYRDQADTDSDHPETTLDHPSDTMPALPHPSIISSP
jgi:hypothetical protein